jgi:hypothetical protein
LFVGFSIGDVIMKKVAFIVLVLVMMLVMAVPAFADPPECNWGTLTSESIAAGLVEQGPHASDPSGDGHGPGTADEPRMGLANVVERGNLEATCELIESLLP